MIEVENIAKVYDNGFQALKDIELKIEDGSLVCLLGPSGCGKTTLLNLISGLLDPSSGDIKMDGQSVIHKHPKDRNIGMVFQNYALYPHMTVLENITFPLRVGKKKKSKEEAKSIAEKYMEMTDIQSYQDQKPSNLSGGQQQRVAIARALVQEPKTLLLDEPLSNLDARLRLHIREEIRRLVKKINITTIFVTHDQEEALSISDKIALMDQGVIQQYSSPKELYNDPNNLFVAKFIGSPVINTFKLENKGAYLEGQGLHINKEDLENYKLTSSHYILAARPEHFHIDPKGELEVIVDGLEMIGRYSIVHFNLADQHIRMTLDSNIPINVNNMIKVHLDTKAIYLFEEDGRRVRTHA